MKWIIFLAAVCFVPVVHCYFSSIYKALIDKIGYEVCDDEYINPDFTKLRMDMNENLFGQDIVIEKLIPILETHFKLEPKKALVICMHGFTGSGKNYATKMLIDALYKHKTSSQFVKMFNGRLHFPLNITEYVNQYKVNIQNWIKGNVTQCNRSLFVFDEIDKMPGGIIDAVKPFFDYHEKIDYIDYRKSIFIFISNIGGDVINSRYMELWRQGKSRKDMLYKDFEPYLRLALYENEGGFKSSSVLDSHLVSLYLPFLPLEREQVSLCIDAELRRQQVPVSDKLIKSVLDEMEFSLDRFSTSGCKRVSDIVASLKYKLRYEEL